METPLVSILIPVYNRVTLVGESIQSSLDQTYKNIEIIIVDNASTDGSWELIKEYTKKDTRIRAFQNNQNIGPVKNWKRCIEEARGYYCKILFSDDLISKNFIEETLKLFDNETAFVLSGVEIFGYDEKKSIGLYRNKYFFSINTYLNDILLFNFYKFPVSPGASIFRTNDLKSSLEVEINNPLNLNFNLFGAGNDLLIFLNIAKNYKKIKVCNSSIAFFRAHKNSITISNNLMTYYEYAMYYFAKKQMPEILSKMKTVIWVRLKRNQTDKSVYNLIDSNVDLIFLFLQSFDFLKFKVLNFLKH